MRDWQPISTAQKSEDEPIQLWNGVKVTSGTAWEGGWVDNWLDWMDPQPTHWQPLAPPPETEA